MNGRDPLDEARGLVAPDLEAVEALMATALSSRAEVISRVSAHLLASGGKRVRALLCLLAARASGFALAEAHLLACCGELVHAASLCHDDVLDQGELRRGQPTVRALYGDPLSILLGDFCLVQAFRLMAEAGLSQAGAELARAVVDMAEGEVIQAQRLSTLNADLDEYYAVAEAKTGALLTWCTSLGGGAPAPCRPSLVSFGRSLGRVYQIADDLLDFEEAGRSGKRAGQDLRAGENTLPLLLACARHHDLRERIHSLRSAAEVDAATLRALLDEVQATGALEDARALAVTEAERAVHELGGLPETPYRAALAGMARFAAERHV